MENSRRKKKQPRLIDKLKANEKKEEKSSTLKIVNSRRGERDRKKYL